MNDNRVRIFVSSPADVDHERAIVKDIVERLAQEFRPYFQVEPILWEEEALTADRTFQAGLVRPSDCEIVLVVLWTRLGSPLPQDPYQGMTGTEWEFFDAVDGAPERRPEVLVYKKTNPKLVDITNPQATLAAIEDRKRLEEFFQRNFFNQDQTFRRAFRVFDSDAAFRNLVEVQLRKLLNRRIFVEKRGAGRAFEWHGSPFRAGRPFDFGDERIFTGREGETRDLLRRLQEQMEAGCGFLLVSGPSGCGKSSLVRAGLLPRLVRPYQVKGVAACRWCLVDPRQGKDPLAALAEALCAREVLGDALAGFGVESQLLRRSLEVEPELAVGQIRAALQGLAGAIREDTGETDTVARLMVVVDPLESVCTGPVPAPFAAALQALAASGIAWVVAVLRSDYLRHLPRLGALAQIGDPRAWLSLEPPAGARIRQVIEVPALVAGLEYESHEGRNLVEQIESETARLRLWPPLLQGTLEHLYRAQRGPGEEIDGTEPRAGYLTLAAFQESGGLAGDALRRAEDLWGRLDTEAREALPRICRALIALDPGAGAHPVPRGGDLDVLEAEPACRRLVGALIEARLAVAEGVWDPALLTPCHSPDYSLKGLLGRVARQTREEWRLRLSRGGAPPPGPLEAGPDPAIPAGADWSGYRRTATLVHPVLLEHWGPMRDWLVRPENREALMLRQRISHQAQLWKRTDCNREYLLGEAGYTAARSFAGPYGVELEAAEAQLLAQSEQRLRFERRRNRLVRATGMAMAVLLLAASAAAFWALDASHTATVNLHRSRLNAADLAIVRGNTPRAVVLALDAGGFLPREALQTLSRAFTSNRLIAMLHEGPPNPELPLAATIDAGGGQAATLDPAVGIRRWRLDGSRFLPLGPAEVGEQGVHSLLYGGAAGDGAFFAVASEGVWRLPLAPGSPPDFPCRSEPGSALAVSPDGRLLAVSHTLARDSHQVCAMDLARPGAPLFEAAVHAGEIRSLAFSADGTRLITASRDRTAKVLDTTTGEVLLTLPPEDGSRRRPIGRAVFGPRGERIAIATTDQGVAIYGADGALVRALARVEGPDGPRQVHESNVQDLAITPDGRFLVAADEDGQVVRWGLGEGNSALVLGNHEQSVVQVRISPDGRQALTASLDKTARLWDLDSGAQVAVFSHDGPVDSAAFSADGRRAFTLSAQDGTARLWRVTTVSRLARLVPHRDRVMHLQFAPPAADDGLRLATAGYDGRVLVATFSRANGALLPEEPLVLEGHSDQVRRVAFSPQGGRLISASADGTARIWDLKEGERRGRMLCRLEVAGQGTPAMVNHALFDPLPAGRWVLTAANTAASPLALWDAQTCARLTAGPALDSAAVAVQALAVSATPAGALAAAGSDDGQVRVVRQGPDGAWTLLCNLKLHTRPVLDVAISPDGGQVASASEDRRARILTLADCGSDVPRVADLAGHTDTVRSVRFSPDGTRLVTASRDGTARVWSATGAPVQVLAGHRNHVYHADFSPDGRWILTAGRDGVVGLWQDPPADAPLRAAPYLVLTSHLGRVRYAAFSPDGHYIGAAYWRDAAQVWRIWADGEDLDPASLASLRSTWGPERADLVLLREAERFRRDNRLDDLGPDEGAAD